MPITPAKARQANVTVITRWQQMFQATPTWWQKIAMREASKTHSNLYAFQNAVGKMKRRGQGIVFRDVSSQAFEVINDRWDDGIKISADDIDDDRLGIYMGTVGMLGNRAAKWPDQQISLLMKNGNAATSLCHDGEPFFSTSHPIDPSGFISGVWSNLDSGAQFALTEATYAAAVAAMMVIADHANEPLGIFPRYLVVPPALRLVAKKILEASLVPSTAGTASNTNVLEGECEVVVIPELAGTSTENATWYLIGEIAGLYPFGWQDRTSPQLIAKVNPTDDNMFFDDELIYAIKARGEFYYGPAYLARKMIGA